MDREPNTNSASNGLIFSEALLILFVALKLVGVIEWSWWWVLSPIWIPLSLALVLLAIYGVICLVEYRSRVSRERNRHQ